MHHLHRLARGRLGYPGAAPRKKVGLELGNNAPVIVEPDADLETAAAKIVVAGYSYSGPDLHLGPARLRARRRSPTTSSTRSVPQVEALVVGDPLDDDTDVSALISNAERDRVRRVDRGGHRWRGQGRDRRRRRRDGVLAPTVLTDVLPDMKVCSQRGVRPGRRACRPTTTSTSPRPRQRHPLRAAGRDLHQRPRRRAARRARARLRRRDRQRGARRSAPTRCPTAACRTAATPARARATRCAR